MLNTLILRSGIAVLLLTTVLSGCTTDDLRPRAQSQPARQKLGQMPALTVTNEPAPEVVYRKGSRDTLLLADDQTNTSAAIAAHMGGESLVARKVSDLNRDLGAEKNVIDGFRDRLSAIQSKADAQASEYYTLVAAIQTELQSGTTAGNPVLTERWNQAQAKLESLSESTATLSALATDISAEASKAAYLQESVRATYGLSGGVKEDRKALQRLEDDVNQSIVGINRLLTATGDEINRRTATLRAEHLNMQTLSLAINNGELYGKNMSNSLYKKVADAEGGNVLKGSSGAAAPAQRRPLVVIRFNRAHVDYQQAVYTAVSQALDKYPAARFDLVAVSPSEGNPAQIALASTEARKNGEAVLRSLTQMGLPMERIRLNAANSRDVQNSEVHLYVQ